MNKLHITALVGDAWTRFTERGWYLAGVSVAAIGLATIVVGNMLTTALSSIVLGGYILLMLKYARKEHVEFDDLFSIDSRWIYYAFGSVIKSILIVLGFLLFIVPGVYLSVRWMFSDLYILEEGMRPIEALKASSALTAGYRWQIFGFMLFIAFITLIGLLCFGVGIFVAMPVSMLSYILVFWKLKELQYLNSQQ